MSRRRREVEELEFDPVTPGSVVDSMDRLAVSRDGWVNLLPGVFDEETEAPRRGIFSAFFGAARPPVSMCTWTPAASRSDGLVETVGVLHARGRSAARQLSELGVPIPAGWRVRQDSSSRGLVCDAVSSSHASTLDWLVRAGTALSKVPLTGMWKARIYLPR